MAQQIQLRNGTAQQWTIANPVLAQGEMGLETDTRLYKIGNGSSTWSALPYAILTGQMEVANLAQPSSEPSLPSAGQLKMYAWDIGGRMMPKWVGPSGVDTTFQAGLHGNGVAMYAPGTATAVQSWGGPALTSVGTVSHPVLATGGQRVSTRRWSVVSAATVDSIASQRIASTMVWRGDAAGLGGFFVVTRFSVVSTVATQRGFWGLSGTTGAPTTTQTPSTQGNILGVGFDNGDTKFSFYHNDAAGASTKIDLGANFTLGDPSAVYELVLFARPNDTEVSYRLKRIDVDPDYSATGTVTGDIPAASTFLTYVGYLNNGGTAAAVTMDHMRIYIESDY